MKRFGLWLLAGLAIAGAAIAQPLPTPTPSGPNGLYNPSDIFGELDQKQNFDTFSQFLPAGQTLTQLLTGVGSIDARSALTACVNAGPCHLQCGVYRLDGTWSVPVTNAPVIIGDGGPGCVIITAAFATGDIISLNQPHDGLLTGFTVRAKILRTSGAAIHYIGGFVNALHNVYFDGPHGADAILLDSTNTMYMDQVQCRTPNPAGTFVVGQFWAGACVHLINNALEIHGENMISNNWQFGREITSSGGAYWKHNDWIANGNAIKYDPSNGTDFVMEDNSLGENADTSYGDNVLVTGTLPVTDLQYSGLWASNSQSANGIGITNTRADGMMFSIATVLANHATGLIMNAGNNLQVSNSQFCMNSQAGFNQFPGIAINPVSTTANVIFSGGFSGQCGDLAQRPGFVNQQSFGILQNPAATVPQSLKVIGMTTLANATGNYNLPAFNTATGQGTATQYVGNFIWGLSGS